MHWCDLAHNSMQIRGFTGELLQHVRRVQQVHRLAEAICVLEVDSVPFDLCVTFNTECQTGLLAAVVRVLRVVPVTRTACLSLSPATLMHGSQTCQHLVSDVNIHMSRRTGLTRTLTHRAAQVTKLVLEVSQE